MPDPTDPAVIAGLWLVAAAAVLWLWVPHAAAALGLSTYGNGGTEDPALAEPDGTDPLYADLVADLAALGYRPLGAGFMRVRFFNGYWVYRTRVRAFRSPAAGSFAFLQETPLFPGVHEVYLATCYDGGRLLVTAVGLAATRREADGYIAEELMTFRPDELDGHHRAAAEAVRRDGWRPDRDLSLAHLLQTTEARSGPSVLAQARALGRQEAWVAVLHLGLVGWAVWESGFWHYAGPTVALLGVGLYLLVFAGVRSGRAAALRRRTRDDFGDPPSPDDPADGW